MKEFLKQLFCIHQYFWIDAIEPKYIGRKLRVRQKHQCLKCDKIKYKYFKK